MTRQYGTINWDAVDWSRPNRELAEELGFSSYWVGQKRKKHAPKHLKVAPRMKPAPPVSDEELRRELVSIMPLSGHYCSSTLALRLRVSVARLLRAAKRVGFEFKSARSAWWRRAPINWDLPDYDLADIWLNDPDKRTTMQQARGYAYDSGLHQRPTARWRRCDWVEKLNHEYRRALSAERTKAKLHWALVNPQTSGTISPASSVEA